MMMMRPDHPLRCSSLLLLRTHMPCLISGRTPTELSRAREMVREARVDAAAVPGRWMERAGELEVLVRAFSCPKNIDNSQ